MDTLVALSIWVALILLALALVGQAIFGLRNLTYGKISPISMLIVVLPVLLMLILGLSMTSWAQAGVITLMIMFGLAVLALLFSGVRNLFSF